MNLQSGSRVAHDASDSRPRGFSGWVVKAALALAGVVVLGVAPICATWFGIQGCSGQQAFLAAELGETTTTLSVPTVQTPVDFGRVGFYMVIYSEVRATLEVLRSTRKYYPEAPIYVFQDGGNVSLELLCNEKRYRCIYNSSVGKNCAYNPHPWFLYLLVAARALNTEFMIILEPDTLVRRRHVFSFQYDAGGVVHNWGQPLSPKTLAYMEKLGGERRPCYTIVHEHWGLTGGSYIRIAAAQEAFQQSMVDRIDWRELLHEEGDRVQSSDLAMTFALWAAGFAVYPWEESSVPVYNLGDPPAKVLPPGYVLPMWRYFSAFEHGNKERYSHDLNDLDPADAHLVRAVEPYGRDCKGCLWYEDWSNPHSAVHSKFPRAKRESDRFHRRSWFLARSKGCSVWEAHNKQSAT